MCVGAYICVCMFVYMRVHVLKIVFIEGELNIGYRVFIDINSRHKNQCCIVIVSFIF